MFTAVALLLTNITSNALGQTLHEGMCVICDPGHIA